MARRVCVIGSGYIGSVIAGVLAQRGCTVTAIDINARLIDAFNNGETPIAEPGLQELVAEGVSSGELTFTTDFSACSEAEVILVTVGTPLAEDYSADLSHVRATADMLRAHVRDGQLLMLKSTVPPGTTREVFAEPLRELARLDFAFSPERLAEGAAIRELTSLPIIVGGIDAVSTTRAAAFWREVLAVEVIEVSSPESAEMVKLADNLWIDLNVALAHDLAKLCDALPYPIDVLEVIKGANSLKKGQHYVNILTPSNGVGGYCLTKDPWFVDALGSRSGVELLTPRTSRAVNDSMPAYCGRIILDHLAAQGVAPGEARVAVLGLAFKTNSGDVRLTPVSEFLSMLRTAGVKDIAVHDPMVHPSEADGLGETLVDSAEHALDGAHCVAFMVGHDEFRAIDGAKIAALVRPGALVFDGRMYFGSDAIAAMRTLGLAFKGVGR